MKTLLLSAIRSIKGSILAYTASVKLSRIMFFIRAVSMKIHSSLPSGTVLNLFVFCDTNQKSRIIKLSGNHTTKDLDVTLVITFASHRSFRCWGFLQFNPGNLNVIAFEVVCHNLNDLLDCADIACVATDNRSHVVVVNRRESISDVNYLDTEFLHLVFELDHPVTTAVYCDMGLVCYFFQYLFAWCFL